MYPHDHLLGKAGQHAAAAQLLALGYNIATPDVDTGDDFLVLTPGQPTFQRVQVKTSSTTPLKTEPGFQAQFWVRTRQLETPKQPDLIYIFAAQAASQPFVTRNVSEGPTRSSATAGSVQQCERRPWHFLVIARKQLLRLHNTKRFGTLNHDQILLGLTFRETKVTGHSQNLQPYRDNFQRYWPHLKARTTS